MVDMRESRKVSPSLNGNVHVKNWVNSVEGENLRASQALVN